MSLQPDQLRCLVQDCIAKHLYSTAVFYADKLVTLTEYAPGDVYLLAQASSNKVAACLDPDAGMMACAWCVGSTHIPQNYLFACIQTYYVSRQFRRAVMLLKTHGVMEDGRFRYLAAKCLAEVDQWDECLTLLGDGEIDDELQEVRSMQRTHLFMGVRMAQQQCPVGGRLTKGLLGGQCCQQQAMG